MNISSQSSVSITITKDEVKDILLEYIKRMAGGVVNKEMQLDNVDGELNNITFVWNNERYKSMK